MQSPKKCDTCGELAVQGVTDCLQTADGWQESEERLGCAAHPVDVPVIKLLDGRVLTFGEWEKERV